MNYLIMNYNYELGYSLYVLRKCQQGNMWAKIVKLMLLKIKI